MAETSEPPPLFGPDDGEGSENVDDDDLFTSASQPKHLTNGRAEVGDIPTQEKPKPVETPQKDEKEDLFADAETEIPLDSPGHDSKSSNSSVNKPDSKYAEPVSSTAKSSSQDGATSSFTVPSRAAESRKVQPPLEEIPEEQPQIEISISDPKKVGDGMNAYMVYKVATKSTLAIFRRTESSVYRRFSDFLGLHEKLVANHQHTGRIIPPPPEKSVIGMTKIKISSKEEPGSTDFVEKRRAALERFVNHVAKHPVLRSDPCFIEFLEKEGDLPKASGTSSLSGAGVMKLFSKVGDSFGKMTFKMDETDQWFEEKQQQIEVMEEQMKKLHSALETLVTHRKELAVSTNVFARSTALLANAEEHTGLSRVLSQLSEVEEKIETFHQDQADRDYFVLSELAKDYIGLMGAVKEVFQQRVKTFKAWKDAEAMLTKKREAKVKLELARKMDKVPQAEEEIKEWEGKVEKGAKDFEDISAVVRREVAQFEKLRVRDFKAKIINYLEGLMNSQQQIVSVWETFLPEVKSIV